MPGPQKHCRKQSSGAVRSRWMLAILRPCWNNRPVAAGEPRIERVEKRVGSLFNRHVPDVYEPVAFPIKPAPLAVFVREVDEVGSVVSLSRSGRNCCQRKGNGHDCPPHVSSPLLARWESWLWRQRVCPRITKAYCDPRGHPRRSTTQISVLYQRVPKILDVRRRRDRDTERAFRCWELACE